MADTLEEVCDRILGNRPQIAPFGALDASLLLDFEQVEREASNAAPKDLIASLGDIKHRITPARFTISGEPSMTEIEAEGPPPSSRKVRRKPVLQSLAPDEINLLSQFSVRNPTMSAFMEAQRNNAKQTGKSSTSHSKVAVSFTGAQQQQQQTPLDASSVPQRPQLSDELRKELAEQRKILMQLHHYQTGRVPSSALEGQRTAVLQAIERCATEEDVRKLETRLHSVNRHYDSQLGSASAALVEANNALRLERLRMEDERRQWRRERTVMASEQARRAAERLQQVEAQATLQSAEVASRSMKLVLGLEKDREELAKQAKLQWNAANTWQHPTSGNNTMSPKAIVPVSSVYSVAPVPKAAQPKPKPKSLSSTVVEEIPAASAPPPTATASFKPSSAAAIAVYSEAPSRALNLPKGRMGKSAGPRRKPTQQPSPGGAVPVLAQSPAAYPKEPIPEIEATSNEPKGEGTGGQIDEGESPAVWQSVGPAVPTVGSDPIKEPAEALPAVIINMPYRSDMDAVRQESTDDSDHRLLVSALSAATPPQGKVEADAEPAAFLTPDSDLQTAFHEYRRRERRIRELYGVVEDDAFDKQDSTMQAVVRGVVHELIADDVREALGGNTEEDQQWATLVQECLLEHVNVHGTPAQTAMSLAALRSAEATRREHQGVVPTANFYATKTLKANSTKPLSTEPEQVEEDSVLSMLRALLDGPMKVPTMDNNHQPVVTCSEPSREHVTPAVQETQATKLPHADMPERDTLQASLTHGLNTRLLDGEMEVALQPQGGPTTCQIPERGGTLNIRLIMEPPQQLPTPPTTERKPQQSEAATETDALALIEPPPPQQDPDKKDDTPSRIADVIELFLEGSVCTKDSVAREPADDAQQSTPVYRTESARVYDECELLAVPHDEDRRHNGDESLDLSVVAPPTKPAEAACPVTPVVELKVLEATPLAPPTSTDTSSDSEDQQQIIIELVQVEIAARNRVLLDEYSELCMLFNEHVPRHRKSVAPPTQPSPLPSVPAPQISPSSPSQPPTDKVTRTILNWFAQMSVVPPKNAPPPTHHLSSMTTSDISSTNLTSYNGRGVHRFEGVDEAVAKKLGKQSPFNVPYVRNNAGGSMTTVTSLTHVSSSSADNTTVTSVGSVEAVRPPPPRRSPATEWWL